MHGKTIVLGVGGGIAAYKACELASRLTQSGARVHVVMTAGAQRFVAPLTFQALTHQPVHTSLWPDEDEHAEAAAPNPQPPIPNPQFAAMAHIRLADAADAVLVAPASANVLARLAHGLADDLLSTIVLATRAPVLLSPAMNPAMLSHPATQKNLAALRELGYSIIEPEAGRMACEHVGSGRLPATDVLLAALQDALCGVGARHASPLRHAALRNNDGDDALCGKTVLVTAGPTREALDAVRFLSNRSSGKMGFALAEEAACRGARAMLISGPVALPTPPAVERLDVTTTQEMFEAATRHAPTADVIIGAAAPADFRPAAFFNGKIKKSAAAPTIELTPTPDIIAHVGHSKKPGQIVVGFAAEMGSGLDEAHRKRREKKLDAVAWNDVSQPDAGFDADTNRVTWVDEEGEEAWPLLSKREVAARLFDRIGLMLRRV